MLPQIQGDFESRAWRAGALKADFIACVDACRTWLLSIAKESVKVEVFSEVKSALESLHPYQNGPSKVLFFQTKGAWTLIVDNRPLYPDPTSAVSVLTKKINCQGLVYANIPDKKDESGTQILYGAVQLELFSDVDTDFLNYRRTISVAHAERGWRFDANGEVQPFEETMCYNLARIQDRFNAKMLISYLKRMELDVEASDLLTGNGVALLRI